MSRYFLVTLAGEKIVISVVILWLSQPRQSSPYEIS